MEGYYYFFAILGIIIFIGSKTFLNDILKKILSSTYKTKYKTTSKKRGNPGEREVDKELTQLAIEYGGIAFLDLLLIDENHSTQIDNILLTDKAIYVIEMKDFAGWIFGSEHNTYWRQTFTHYKAKTSGNNYTKSGVSRYSFYNPIKQNAEHIRVLKKLLRLPHNIRVFNIVVFGFQSTLKDIKHSKHNYVVRITDLYFLIDDIEKTLPISINLEEMIEITDAIYSYDSILNSERTEHIRRIEDKYNTRVIK